MNDDKPNYGTPYTESELILAAQQGDWDNVRTLANTMLPGERLELARACDDLSGFLLRMNTAHHQNN